MAISRAMFSGLLSKQQKASSLRTWDSTPNPWYNNATGGTTVEVSNYNGSGNKYRVHTFSSVGTASFVVTDNPKPFRTLIVAGGSNGTTTGYYSRTGYGGNGGKILYNDSETSITVATHTVTVGAGNGGTSSLGSLSSTNGSVVGGGGSAQNCCNTGGGSGGNGLSSTINGSATYYGGGGGGGGSAGEPSRPNGGGGGLGGGGTGGYGSDFNGNTQQAGGAASFYGGGGGGAGGTGDRDNNNGYNWNNPDAAGGSGYQGVVIVAYQIGA